MAKRETKPKQTPIRKQKSRRPVRPDVSTDEDGLAPRMRLFIDHYIANGWNGTQAAISAGYSRNGAAVTASKLLIHPNVKRALARALEATHLTKEKVLARLGEMATSNLADFTTSGGRIDADEFKRRGYLVKTLRRQGRTVTIELHDSQRALETIGKHLGLFTDVESGGGVPVFIPLTVDPRIVTG